MVREMMLFHVRGASDVEQKIAQGRALLKFLASSKKEPDLYRDLLQKNLSMPSNTATPPFITTISIR
jgi:Predicted methyltransferase regulatory domain.